MTNKDRHWTECPTASYLIGRSLAHDLAISGAQRISISERGIALDTNSGPLRVCYNTRLAALDPTESSDASSRASLRGVDNTLRVYGITPVIGSMDLVRRSEPEFYKR